MTDRARELLERAFESMKNRTLLTENERNLEKEISYYLLSTPEPTQDEEPVSNTDIYPFCGVVKMPEGWNTFANQETDTNSSECIALLEVRLWDDGKECYYKTLAEDLPIGTYELYLAVPEPTQDDEPFGFYFEPTNLKDNWFYPFFKKNKGEDFKTIAPAKVSDLYLHPAPRPEFVRLSEEEVSEILSSAYDMYAAICAVENRLVEKNRDR